MSGPKSWARGVLAALAAALLLLGLAPVARAQAALPAQLFFEPPKVLDFALSPSGRRLALSVQAPNKRVGVFVFDLQQAGLPATRAALFGDADVPDLQVGLGEDQDVAPGLFAARFDGQELRQLVERHGRSFISNGEPGRTLTWNHKLLHVPVPSERADGARADEVIVGAMSFRRGALVHLQPKWLNTRTGATRTLWVDAQPDGAVQWWFSPQGVPRLVRTREDGREALHWYTPAAGGARGQWRQIAEGPLYRLPFQPLWVGEGERLDGSLSRGAAGEAVVAPFNFATGQPGETLVNVPGFDFSGRLLGDRSGERLLGVRVDADAEQTVWFSAAHKAAQERVDKRLPGRVNRITCRRCGNDDAVVLVRSFTDRLPGELLLWRQTDNSGQGGWQRVALQIPGIDPERMGRLDLERIRARDTGWR